MDCVELIQELVALQGPPGEEKAVAEYVQGKLSAMGYTPEIDAKGNVLVHLDGTPGGPNVLVTAHLDEIALIVTRIEEDGRIRVAASGGAHTWKWGEGPVDILTRKGSVPAILSYGCIHTNNEQSVAEYARHHALDWGRAYLFTGLEKATLEARGVRVGLRVVLAASRRQLTTFESFLSGYFLDDRADIATMLLALEMLKADASGTPPPYGRLTFAATTSEEVGGLGALFIMHRNPIDICVALEIGPRTPDTWFPIDSQPTIWVRDGYAAMDAIDGDILTDCCEALGQKPHWHYLSRGGSDATCAASKGLCARPVTLAFPVENSHGYEIMHRDGPHELARLLLAYLKAI